MRLPRAAVSTLGITATGGAMMTFDVPHLQRMRDALTSLP
jgi:hypothetical protein